LIHFFIGTKAQLIKTAPVMLELDRRGIAYRYIDSGQHGSFSSTLRGDFGLREPDYFLNQASGDVATMARGVNWLWTTFRRFAFRPQRTLETVFGGERGACVIHGDTASTLIGAWLARTAGLSVVHLEAGLRSYNWFNPFPEELIRIWCMHRASLLFAPTEQAMQNLARMRVRGECVYTHGNTVHDALRIQQCSGRTSDRAPGSYVLAACHRFETIRSRRRLAAVVSSVNQAAETAPVLFVMHRPTEHALRRFGLMDTFHPAVELLPTQEYFSFVALMRDARFVMADGGSIQEECAALGLPLLILRSHSEREDGLGETAFFAGFDRNRVAEFLNSVDSRRRPGLLDSGVSPSVLIAEKLLSSDTVSAQAANVTSKSDSAATREPATVPYR
jgi:UDP-N-acetylglucosamine 2-epimerase (non-hydrolysing)